MANSGVYFTLGDYNGEGSTSGIRTGAVTATSLPGLLTQIGAMRTAIAAVTNGEIREEGWYGDRTRLSNAYAGSADAQREKKWLIVYEDNQPFFDPGVNAIPNAGYKKVFNIEIATADLSAVTMIANTDRADLSQEPMSALVTAFEAMARSPYNGTVNVLDVIFVGRAT